ncbi:hypothetical protein OZ411_07375, partial [Bradyrhizobium sp. Arg237L]|uniref:hypothetical protein n=1 Tax=Bradyrhizobium sp. Arg237L TaxID=3003352 RepID=UPI00249E3792
RDPWVQPAPGFPCALCYRGGWKVKQSSGAMRRENANAHPLFESDVGWVERSETHHSRSVLAKLMGFASLYPSYGTAV